MVDIGLTDLKKNLGGAFRRPCIKLECIPHPFFSIAIKGTSQSQVANLVANSQLAYSFAKKKYQKTQVGGIFARTIFQKKIGKSKAKHFFNWIKIQNQAFD